MYCMAIISMAECSPLAKLSTLYVSVIEYVRELCFQIHQDSLLLSSNGILQESFLKYTLDNCQPTFIHKFHSQRTRIQRTNATFTVRAWQLASISIFRYSFVKKATLLILQHFSVYPSFMKYPSDLI